MELKLDKLLIVLFPLFVLLLSSFFLILNPLFYNLLFDISESPSVAYSVKWEVLSFLTYISDDIVSFNEVELIHMFEVRQVMTYFFVLFLVLLIVYLSYLNLNVLWWGGWWSLILLTSFVFLPFNLLFVGFHEFLFFGQWTFPQDYLMIQVFNKTFFYVFFVCIIVLTSLLSMFCVFFGYLKKKITKV